MLGRCDAVRVLYDPKRHRLGIVPGDPEAQDTYIIHYWDQIQIVCRKLFEFSASIPPRRGAATPWSWWTGADSEPRPDGRVMAAEATPRPWNIGRAGRSIWIEGPKGSAVTERLPDDRRIVCDFRLFGDDVLDAETEANFALIIERVNGGGR